MKLQYVLISCIAAIGLQCFSQVETSQRYTGPIIDMHIHAYNNESPIFGSEFVNPLTNKLYKASKDLMNHTNENFERFDTYNVVLAMVSQHSENWYAKDSTRILNGKGYKHSIEDLRSLHAKGKLDVIGEVAPNYDGVLPNDDILIPYFDLAVELDIPIAFHMYPGGPPGGAYMMYPKTRAHQGKPLQLEEILINRPNLKIYIMHAGWPYLEDMKALMYAHPQVYVDTGVISWALPQKEFHNYLEGLINAGFGKRILFGTDQMEWPQTIDEAITNVNAAKFLTLDQKADIFYNNAARFLNLDEATIQKHHKE